MPRKRRICFVTGTRAEFGLMRTTLAAIRDHPSLELQLIVTGTHTQRSRGHTVDEIVAGGWRINATIPWRDRSDGFGIAAEMGRATATLADELRRLKSDIVLVVGDRVEAFAAASAAQVGGAIVAHVHGGDRALGQVDDCLRHAISKLSHVHFPATRASGARLVAMGEDQWRVRVVGTPGIDNIRQDALDAASVLRATMSRSSFVLFLLHPTDADDRIERRRVARLLRVVRQNYDGRIVGLLSNGDPGSLGIDAAVLDPRVGGHVTAFRHVHRSLFLGLLRDCDCLIGNSSAGIIEAGAFGTAVVDVGQRQAGRERGPNVIHAEWKDESIERAIVRALQAKRTPTSVHPYGGGGTGKRIANALATMLLDDRCRRKLIRY